MELMQVGYYVETLRRRLIVDRKSLPGGFYAFPKLVILRITQPDRIVAFETKSQPNVLFSIQFT